MGSIELPPLARKIIPNCKFRWSQKVINNVTNIISYCEDKEKIKNFIQECEGKIKNMDKECRIAWNTEIHRFGGDEFAYVWFFYSDIFQTPIKLSLKIEELSQYIFIGNIDIANKREERKLVKHLEQPSPIQPPQQQ